VEVWTPEGVTVVLARGRVVGGSSNALAQPCNIGSPSQS
jgi:hypothetical protein